MTTRRSTAGGFTLIEAMIATVVLAVAVIGVLSLVNSSYAHTRSLQRQAMALSLARQLVEEIAAKPFNGPRTGGFAQGQTDRHQYDEIADYAGYVDAAPGLTTSTGQILAFDTDTTFERKVQIVPISAVPGMPTDQGAVIRISVTPNSDAPVVLQWLATNVDPAREVLQ